MLVGPHVNATSRMITAAVKSSTSIWVAAAASTRHISAAAARPSKATKTPPDGWCYEGMHTTDVKRARFRADSTSDGDMLEPCDELDCHTIRSPPPRPRRAHQAAPPPPVDLVDSDDDDNDNASRDTEDSPVVVEIVGTIGAVRQNTVGQRRTKATAGTLAHAHVRVDASRGTSGAESSKAGKVRASLLSRSIAELAIHPAVDPLDSKSRMLDPRIVSVSDPTLLPPGCYHCTVAFDR
ncbi:hypothetical protein EDB85DRAFT_2137254 [Lactarius pseudohatsudake]|nr:hypothetical protein EDB85DRAFT_2137254 [Lactarius pseudohatsudake]